jgi:hypothetical protein
MGKFVVGAQDIFLKGRHESHRIRGTERQWKANDGFRC